MEVHFFACAFWFLARMEGPGAATWFSVDSQLKPHPTPDHVWPHYLLALYWSSTTLATIGYGVRWVYQDFFVFFCSPFLGCDPKGLRARDTGGIHFHRGVHSGQARDCFHAPP